MDVSRFGLVTVLVGCGSTATPAASAETSASPQPSGSSGASEGTTTHTASVSQTVTSGEATATSSAKGSTGGSTGASRLDLGDAAYDCDAFAQDCPPGYKCLPWSNDGNLALDATWCRPVVPDGKGAGEPCTAEGNHQVYKGDDCDADTMCWFVDWSSGEGACVPSCLGTPDAPACPGECRTCMQDPGNNTHLCVQQCDPLATDCPDGETCVPNLSHEGFACDHAGGLAEGEACRWLNECQLGHMCVDATGAPGYGAEGLTCRSLCDPAEPCSDPELDCVRLRWQAACASGPVGVCIAPA